MLILILSNYCLLIMMFLDKSQTIFDKNNKTQHYDITVLLHRNICQVHKNVRLLNNVQYRTHTIQPVSWAWGCLQPTPSRETLMVSFHASPVQHQQPVQTTVYVYSTTRLGELLDAGTKEYDKWSTRMHLCIEWVCLWTYGVPFCGLLANSTIDPTREIFVQPRPHKGIL